MTHTVTLGYAATLEDLFALVRNRFPGAQLNGNEITLSDTATLTWDEAAHSATIDVPKERDEDLAPAFGDGYGLNRAFADGVPSGHERDVLEFALSAVRRLGGKLTTDSGKELSPHQFMLPDLTVVAAHELEPGDVLETVQKIVREASLEGEPEEAPFEVELPIFDYADLQVRVEPLEVAIPAIAHVQWVQEGAVTYAVRYLSREGEALVVEEPDEAQIKEWREAYLGCAAIAKVLHDEVGGFVLDAEGYLVDPHGLI